jgi:hypothetical protein
MQQSSFGTEALYCIENTLSYCWKCSLCMAHCKDVNEVAIGFVPIHLGRDEPRIQDGPIWKTHLYLQPPYSLQTNILFSNHFRSLLWIHHPLCMFCYLSFALPTHCFHFRVHLLNRSFGNINFLMLPPDFVPENVLSLIQAQLHPKRTSLLFTIILQQEHGGLSQASMSTRPSLCCNECWQHLRLLFQPI